MRRLIGFVVRAIVRAEQRMHERYVRCAAIFAKWRHRTAPYWRVLWSGRSSIVLGMLAIVLVGVPMQAREALGVVVSGMATTSASNVWQPDWRPWVVMLLAAVLCSIALWYSYRVILKRRFPDGKHRARVRLAFFIRHAPRLVSMLPFAGLLLGFLNLPVFPAEHELWRWATLAVIVGLAGGTYWMYWVRERATDAVMAAARRLGARVMPRASRALQDAIPREQWERLWTWAGVLIVFALGALIAAGYVADPVEASGHGPIGIVLLGLLIWVCVGALLVNISDEFKWPVTTAVLLLPLVWSRFDWNDNHAARLLPGQRRELSTDVQTDFPAWLAARPDLDLYERGDYPIIVVSAEGGGIYAAYHAAMMLAALQDEDPSFASHVYAISGVSGGSVGASIFAAMAQHDTTLNLVYQQSVRDVLSVDLLSPLMAKAAFPDLLQRFLPWPIERWDRATGLEAAIESAWVGACESARVLPRGALAQSAFDREWTRPGRMWPVLALNTTRVETGERVVLSPLRWGGLGARSAAVFMEDLNEDTDLRLVTAATLSARFPLVTPAGFVMAEPVKSDGSVAREKVRLVDGGYFENTGAATLMEILDALPAPSPTLDYRLIVITIRAAEREPKPHSYSFGEVMSPLRAMLGTRGARGRESLLRLKSRVEQWRDDRARHADFVLPLDKAGPPLGWLLSESSRNKIEATLRRGDGSPGSAGSNASALDNVQKWIEPGGWVPGSPER